MHSEARPGWLGRGAGGVGPRRGARGRGGSHPGRAAECIGRRMHPAAECIRQPNAFRGSMHSEAVCIRRQYAFRGSIGYCLLPIAYCLSSIIRRNSSLADEPQRRIPTNPNDNSDEFRRTPTTNSDNNLRKPYQRHELKPHKGYHDLTPNGGSALWHVNIGRGAAFWASTRRCLQ